VSGALILFTVDGGVVTVSERLGDNDGCLKSQFRILLQAVTAVGPGFRR
jgi:hypothetical protein